MYIKRKYGFFMTLNWSKIPFILGLLYASAIEIDLREMIDDENIPKPTEPYNGFLM